MFFLFLITQLLCPSLAFANFNDFFGTGYSTSIIGGQSNGKSEDPNNIYYAPALHGPNQGIHFAANMQFVRHDFNDINNVVVKNSSNNTNSSSTYTERANIKVDYPDYKNSTIGLLLPLKYEGAGTVALSYSGPLGSLIEANTGNSFNPEYVMYHSRYRRSMLEFHYAHPFLELFAFSLGAKMGFQTGADINTQASLSGTGYGSSGSAKAKVDPSLGAILSLALKNKNYFSYFLFSQEMKQYLHSNVNGEINDPPAPFDVTVDTMLYYDPYTFRLGGGVKGESFDFFASADYQLWSGYRTPIMRINKKTFISSSNDYEKTTTQNILIPRLGLMAHLGEKLDWGFGVVYRPTPLKKNFNNAGNSIDADTYTLSTGPQYRFQIFNKNIETGFAFQYQKLIDHKVNKTSGQENGQNGDKIGSPGYTIGGTVLSAAFGIRITL